MRDVLKFAQSVARHWGSLVTGGVAIGLLGIWQGIGHPVRAWVYWTIAVVGLVIAVFKAWLGEHGLRLRIEDEKAIMEKKYFDERPQLGLEVDGPKGPNAWLDAMSSDACWFWLQHLSGRNARSIRFDPIPSKRGRFALCFDPVPFLDPPRRTSLTYRIQEVGVPPLTAHDMDKIGDIQAKMLGLFLDDSPLELIELHYVLTVRFKDREDEERTHTFHLVFDKRTFAFWPDTEAETTDVIRMDQGTLNATVQV